MVTVRAIPARRVAASHQGQQTVSLPTLGSRMVALSQVGTTEFTAIGSGNGARINLLARHQSLDSTIPVLTFIDNALFRPRNLAFVPVHGTHSQSSGSLGPSETRLCKGL